MSNNNLTLLQESDCLSVFRINNVFDKWIEIIKDKFPKTVSYKLISLKQNVGSDYDDSDNEYNQKSDYVFSQKFHIFNYEDLSIVLYYYTYTYSFLNKKLLFVLGNSQLVNCLKYNYEIEKFTDTNNCLNLYRENILSHCTGYYNYVLSKQLNSLQLCLSKHNNISVNLHQYSKIFSYETLSLKSRIHYCNVNFNFGELLSSNANYLYSHLYHYWCSIDSLEYSLISDIYRNINYNNKQIAEKLIDTICNIVCKLYSINGISNGIHLLKKTLIIETNGEELNYSNEDWKCSLSVSGYNNQIIDFLISYNFSIIHKPFHFWNISIDYCINNIFYFVDTIEWNIRDSICGYEYIVWCIKNIIEDFDKKFVKIFRNYDVKYNIETMYYLKKNINDVMIEIDNRFVNQNKIINIPIEFREEFDNKQIMLSSEICKLLVKRIHDEIHKTIEELQNN